MKIIIDGNPYLDHANIFKDEKDGEYYAGLPHGDRFALTPDQVNEFIAGTTPGYREQVAELATRTALGHPAQTE